MSFLESSGDIFSSVAVFLFGLGICWRVGRSFGVASSFSVGLYGWHTAFCLIYAWFVMTDGGDSVTYFANSLAPAADFKLGTWAVVYLVSIFSAGLGLSFLGVSLVFNIFGAVGLLALYGALRLAVRGKSLLLRRAAFLIVLLPSVSFWSSGIGKDPISFMATCLAIWAALDLRRRSGLMALAIVSMLYVRPHVAGLMVIALMLALIVHAKVPVLHRVVFGLITAMAASALVPFAMEYSGLGVETDFERVMEFVENRQGHNLHGGGAVDIASMSLPMQLFTYLFRPLPFEADSLFQLAASLDNVILLALFVFAASSLLKGGRASIQSDRIFLWFYALSAWVMLAMTTANLGISVRQKWMFVPVILFLLLSVTGKVRKSADAGATTERPTGPEAGDSSLDLWDTSPGGR